MDRNILHAQSTYSVQRGCFSGEDDLCQTCTIDAKNCGRPAGALWETALKLCT